MRKIFLRIITILAAMSVTIALTACAAALSNGSGTDTPNDRCLVVVSPHPVDFMRPLINEFETETGIKVVLKRCGTSEAIEMMESGENVDILFGGSILSVGPYNDLFLPYKTPNTDNFYEEYQDVGEGMTCFTDMPSILMVNTDLIGNIDIKGYEDLLDPRLKGRIAYANPDRSSSSFEQLVNMLYAMGDGDPEKGWDFEKEFVSQLDGKLLSGSSDVYNGVARGEYVVGLTFEEAAITTMKSGGHVRIIYMEEGVVSTADGIYINKNTQNPGDSESFVDFMTSYDTQNVISGNLGRRSVRTDVEPSGFVRDKGGLNIIEADHLTVFEHKEEWIDKFLSLTGEESHE